MYYVIAIRNRELKRITATEDKVFAKKMLKTDKDYVMETKIFTDKNKCVKFLNLHCDNLENYSAIIDEEVARYKDKTTIERLKKILKEK